VLVVVGTVLILLGGGLQVGGGIGLWIHQQRDADGYHTADPGRLTTDTFAVFASDPILKRVERWTRHRRCSGTPARRRPRSTCTRR